jgi:hypothetical protein
MSYAARNSSFAAALFMSSALATTTPRPPAGTYEARVAGALALDLRGTTAEFGTPAASPTPFVITLGATSESGAVLFTHWEGRRPAAGTYEITADPSLDGIQALVVTGPPTRPTGVFWARRGRLTISSSGVRSISARFEMEVVGFLAGEPDHEDRELTVKGSFTASPSRRAAP